MFVDEQMLTIRDYLKVIIVAVLLCGLLVVSGGAGENPDLFLNYIMTEIRTELEPSEEQAIELEAAITTYLDSLDRIHSGYETGEETDLKVLLGEVLRVRDEYLKSVQATLEKEQWERYLELRQEVLQSIFIEIAGLRVVDLKVPLSLNTGQMERMKPVISEAIGEFVHLLFEYGGRKMNMRTKLRIYRSVKSIQSDHKSQMKKILSNEQWKTWEQLRESHKC